MKQLTVPLLVVIAVYIVTAMWAFRFRPDFFAPIAVVGGLLVIGKMIADYDWMNHKIDNPDPVLYNVKPLGVWTQVKKALGTVKTAGLDVDVKIDHPEPQPRPGKPRELHASITINHPELADMKDCLKPKHQNLQSSITLVALVTQEGAKSKLQLRWTVVDAPATRLEHNEVIKQLGDHIDSLIKEHES